MSRYCCVCGLPIDGQGVLIVQVGKNFFYYCRDHYNIGRAVRTRINKYRFAKVNPGDKPCARCANEGWDMPQCADCSEKNLYRYYIRRKET